MLDHGTIIGSNPRGGDQGTQKMFDQHASSSVLNRTSSACQSAP